MKSICLTLIFFTGISVVSDEWKLLKETDGIKVYTRKLDESKYEQIKLIFNVKAPLSEIVYALEDVKHHKDWVYATEESYIIHKRTPDDFDYYITMKMPFPVKDRDLVVYYKRHQNKATKTVTMISTSKPDVKKLRDGYVRIMDFKSKYTLRMLKNGFVEIEYFLDADPGGSVPAWLVNLVTTKGPIVTMKTLTKDLENGKYKGLKAKDIIE